MRAIGDRLPPIDAAGRRSDESTPSHQSRTFFYEQQPGAGIEQSGEAGDIEIKPGFFLG